MHICVLSCVQLYLLPGFGAETDTGKPETRHLDA
jgi:hypothetical protein